MRPGIYQIKVTLKGSSPTIWRRFQISGNTSLHKLHQVLQVVMGWTNSHLYRFDIGDSHFGESNPEYEDYGIDMRDAKRAKLSQVVPFEKALQN